MRKLVGFLSHAILSEGLRGKAADERSAELATRLTSVYGNHIFSRRHPGFKLVVRWTPGLLMYFALFTAANLFDPALVAHGGATWLVVGIGSYLFAATAALLLSPIQGIMGALDYIKACRIGGESLDEIARRMTSEPDRA